MKKSFPRRICAALLASAMFSVPIAVFADGGETETAEPYIHCAAYYDNDGVLVGTKPIRGKLTDDEVNVLANLYEPETAEKAKVFQWTQNLKPVDQDSGKSIDISDDEDIVILHTNDMHGSLIGSSSVIGSDSVAALKELDDAILVDAGDAVQGVALASQSSGEDVITIMNAAGYNVMAVGNHEFDYGLEQFKKLREMADFPIISSNTYFDGKLLCADGADNNGENFIITKNNVTIGFFALTTTNTKTSTKPENVDQVEFRDEVDTAKEQIEKLKAQNADVIIAVTHMGYTDLGACTSVRLAEELGDSGLDAIIDGHTHQVINQVSCLLRR